MSDASDSAPLHRTDDGRPAEDRSADRTPDGRTPGHPFRSWLGITVLLLLGLIAAAGFKSYRDFDEVRSQEVELRQNVAATEQRIRRIEARIERIENDPWTLERLAREELGMVRPDDLVIVLPEEEAPFPPPPEL